MDSVSPFFCWLVGFFSSLLFVVTFICISYIRRFLKSSSSDFNN